MKTIKVTWDVIEALDLEWDLLNNEDKEIEKLAHKNFPHGSTAPIGSRDRSLYENKKESFINGFKASQNYH